nr:AarF/ABC1/UbiB kinase family protein [Planctomycetota bacterium]
MLVRRTIEGLALVGWLGGQYLAAAFVGRAWTRPSRAWRRWLDGHGARLLIAYIRRHGALLIKIGQFIAMRPDLFPLAYVDACAPLRDQAPARPFAAIRAALDHIYEGRVDDHFAAIEPEALAAASFGQVHRARLHDGRTIALKVQYPGLAAVVRRDLFLARVSLRLFAIALPGWPFDQVYGEIARTSREEQDYLHEASAADRLRDGLKGQGVSVPEVLWEHTREKALAMEFAPGVTLAQLDAGALDGDERRRIADTVIDGFLHMLLDEGFFHADPHAGNLLYDRSVTPARLWLIDFGMTAAISPRESALYRRFLDRLRAHDTDGMVDVLIELGFVMPGVDRSRLKALAREVYDSVAHLTPKALKGSRRQFEIGAKINEFLRRIEGLAFPLHTLLLSRATSLIEGVCMELVPGSNLLDLVRPRLGRLTTLRGQVRN